MSHISTASPCWSGHSPRADRIEWIANGVVCPVTHDREKPPSPKRSRSLVWVEQVDLGSAEMLKESRRHLDFLRGQLRETNDAIDSARSCIDASWELLAQ